MTAGGWWPGVGRAGRRHLVIADIPEDDPAADGSAKAADPRAAADPANRRTAGGQVRRLLAADFPAEGTDLAEDGRFAPDGSAVYLRTVAGRERFALGVVPLDEWGVPGRLRDPGRAAGRRPGVVRRARRRGQRHAGLECRWGQFDRDQEPPGTDRPGRTGGSGAAGGSESSYRIDLGQRVLPGWSVHRDGRSAILELSEAVAPRSLYHVDLADPGESAAGSSVVARTGEPPHRVAGLPEPALARDGLVAPESLTYRSTDGLVLQGLLYRPRGGHRSAPTVVLLHGGPESQERPAFSILIQSLVAAGLAVFAPNVRGSTGYGSAFVAMDDLDRRESSFQDVPATVELPGRRRFLRFPVGSVCMVGPTAGTWLWWH